MKKFFLTLLGVAFVVGVYAQEFGITAKKVNVEKLKSDIAKSDAEIADAKKAAKAATWLKRGDVFVAAEFATVGGLYMGMPETMLKLAYGDAAPEQIEVGGKSYILYPYEHFKAYVSNGNVDFYVPTTAVAPAALDKAYEAYAKAYELDVKSVKKVKDAMDKVRGRSIENGGAYYTLGEFGNAADNFKRAYVVSIHPAVNHTDTMSVYYAGMSAVWANRYEESIKDLNKALELGWEAEGETYRLKFLALYSLEQKEQALETLQTGLSRYPGNEDLIDMMMKYYAENDGDPSSMIPLVEEAIAKNPSNPSLYQGLARVYDKLGQIDNAIEAVKKAVALAPDDFFSNYLEGLFILKKGDILYDEYQKMQITSRAQNQQAYAIVKEAYAKAIAPLEKAYSIESSEPSTVELLKSVTFRFRDDSAEMMEKFTKYDALYKSMTE